MQVHVQINADAKCKQCFFPGQDKRPSPFRSLEVLLPAVSWLTSIYEVVDVERQVILAVLDDNLLSFITAPSALATLSSGLPSLSLTQGLRGKVYMLYEVFASVH